MNWLTLLYLLYESQKKPCIIAFPSIVFAPVLTCAVWEEGGPLLSNIVFAVGSIEKLQSPISYVKSCY